MKNSVQPVNVTVLYTEGCVGTPPTVDLIHDVAAEINIKIWMNRILVESLEQALELKFLGSPTVQVNGMDIDPVARDNSNFGLM